MSIDPGSGSATVLVREPDSHRWRIGIKNFPKFQEALGPDVLSAFCRCFVHADRLSSLVSCAYISERHYGTESIAFHRNLHTTVWFTIGTLKELTRAISACRAALAKRGRLEIDSAPWQTLQAFERRWASDPLVAQLRNQAVFHVDDEVISAGLVAMAASQDVVLSKGEGPKADHSSLILGQDALFLGLDLDIHTYGAFLARVAEDQAVGDAVQLAFIHATEGAGIPFG